ncbi:MAG: hypothetical protein J6I85_00430 [Clostridia bacterium]|nr:hypothetical protein [Clostridia bacterium]
MSIETELKKNGIEVIKELDSYTIDQIAQKVANRLYQTFPNYGFSEEEIYSKLSNLNMYKAKMPEGMSEANYFYKNSSIYFNINIPNEDLEEFAVHECIHHLQEVKDKKNNLVKMGLSDYSDSDVYGLGLNEAAVQLMACKAIGIQKDFVKYFDINFESISPSYYPLECCLVNQLAYLLGEDVLFESTLNSNNNFKEKFISEMSIKTYICVQNALDSILEAEENIIKLNNKILEFDERNKRCENMSEKINEIKSEILLTFLKTQNQIISSYFNSSFKKIKTLEDVEKYRRKLYNFKDYLGSTDGYTFYHNYYVEQMAALEHKYNILENGGTETALQVSNKKQNWFTLIINKIKSLFEKKEVIKESK